jgi:hypothetical protein
MENKKLNIKKKELRWIDVSNDSAGKKYRCPVCNWLQFEQGECHNCNTVLKKSL